MFILVQGECVKGVAEYPHSCGGWSQCTNPTAWLQTGVASSLMAAPGRTSSPSPLPSPHTLTLKRSPLLPPSVYLFQVGSKLGELLPSMEAGSNIYDTFRVRG